MVSLYSYQSHGILTLFRSQGKRKGATSLHASPSVALPSSTPSRASPDVVHGSHLAPARVAAPRHERGFRHYLSVASRRLALLRRRRQQGPGRGCADSTRRKHLRRTVETQTEELSQPARVRPFIPRVCKYSDQNDLGGGATLAHWSEEKGGVNLL